MRFEEFLKRLKKLKGSNSQYIALCPAHHDTRQSLSVARGDDGKILLYCHAGCTTAQIVSAMGLKIKDLFESNAAQNCEETTLSSCKGKHSRGKQIEKVNSKEVTFGIDYQNEGNQYQNNALKHVPVYHTKHRSKPKRTIVERYAYTDKDGVLRNQKTRWSDKSFDWSHKENGKWVKGHKGEPVLYNLPCTVTAQHIYVVEGEKDVETLKAYKKAAVCSAHGGGTGKWLPQYTASLMGKEVVIIPDNDAVGRAFALETANALYPVAKSVKVLDLTDEWEQLKEHGDCSDLFAMQHANDVLTKLQALELVTPMYEPQMANSLFDKHAEKVIEEIPGFYHGTKFLHHAMGDYLIKKYAVCKINDALHIYDNGIYKQGENILYGYMIKLDSGIRDAQRREVFKYIKANLDTPVKEVSPPYLIPFATQIYNLKTNTFCAYSSDYVFLNRFPYDYHPNAKEEPLIQSTIERIAGNDKEVINLLYEAIGNCFYLLNTYRGAVMLYGKSGSNGKSTLLNLIIKLLGRENTSFLSLQDTCEKFRLIEVYGKAANIGDDIPSTYIPNSSVFKKLVTGEHIIAEKKQQDPISFEPYAKLFFTMNELPAVKDKSKAFFSRLLLIPLNQDFSKSSVKNVSLKTYNWSKSEMEYVTKLAVEGLKRLIKNGDFTRPLVVQKALEAYETENNPMKEFINEFTEIHGIIAGRPIEEVYENYVLWCGRSGHKNQLSRTKFTREVCAQLKLKSESVRHSYFRGRTGRCFVAQ